MDYDLSRLCAMRVHELLHWKDSGKSELREFQTKMGVWRNRSGHCRLWTTDGFGTGESGQVMEHQVDVTVVYAAYSAGVTAIVSL